MNIMIMLVGGERERKKEKEKCFKDKCGCLDLFVHEHVKTEG